MPNPYHDETGRFCSKGEMQAAIQDLAKRGDLEGYFALRTELELIDGTQKRSSVSTPNSSVKPVADTDGLVPIILNDNHSYSVPTYERVGSDLYAPVNGSKFTGYRDITDIAKDVRADLKEAQEKGYLPKDLSYSVKGHKYSGGQSIDVTIHGAQDESISNLNNADPYRSSYTPEAKELQKRVDAIAGAYNSDATRAEIDYFQTMYYSRANLESKSDRDFRLKASAQAKVKRDTKPIRDEFKAEYQKDAEKALTGINFTHDKEGSSVGRVGNSNIFVYKSEIMGRTRVRAYDLSDTTFKDGVVPEEYVLKYAVVSKALERKNFLRRGRLTVRS